MSLSLTVSQGEALDRLARQSAGKGAHRKSTGAMDPREEGGGGSGLHAPEKEAHAALWC